MAAANTDKLRKLKSRFSTTLSSSLSAGATTAALSSASGLPTDTAITLTVDRVDADGNSTPSAIEVITGVISGSNLTNLLRNEDGTSDLAHDSGAVVEMIWNADIFNDMIDHLLVEHNQDGSHKQVKGMDNDSFITAENNAGSADIDMFKVNASDEIEAGANVDIKSNTLKTDTIAESTSAAGVTIDGTLIKDKAIKIDTISEDTSANGVAIDGLTIKDAGFALGSDADGDIYYRSGGALVRLGIGSDDEVLTLASGVPTWAAAAGGGTDLTEAPGSDHSGNGITITLTAGENLVFGEVCYFKSDGKMWKADADAIATGFVMGMALGTINADATGSFLVLGIARDDTWAWTVGGAIYLSTTAGALTQTAPSGADDVVVVLGIATHADRMFFKPSFAPVEHTG